MKKVLLFVGLLAGLEMTAQTIYTLQDTGAAINSATKILETSSQNKVTLGGYAQLDYNQSLGGGVKHNGVMDVHRLILLFGYKFSDKTSFVSELEVEHVNEFFVEQAFLNHSISSKLNIRAGLMLIPMGIVNEYHEPPTYNGVERPNLDKYIVPSTWREMGIGITGKFNTAALRYQLYLFNGFKGYDNGAKFRGVDGYRKGRQKAAKSIYSYPNFSGKLDYYGILGLKLGLSGYFGKSQTTLKDGVNPSDALAMSAVDSSVINMAMLGFDARYQKKGFTARGQFIYSSNQNTEAYNLKGNTDLGSALMGYYVEAGYDVLRFFRFETSQKLVAFARYETYNTHFKMYDDKLVNDAYNRSDITTGLSYHIAPGAVFKIDYQHFMNKKEGSKATDAINLGVGWWF